ncbi:hypothetical protein IQ260_14610 [Leptolyngbya cf. ectocarpi LEGE 11479]|uniref:Zinc ribbon domain-containing protein n=1 Tax=Leptolyngbya cf. ectocarpi LEGE 11479 TaxID=1828722 RepID=A0A929FAC7_LEPEC|nr:hypothetical protein [Leptolyngbya ectocarpi]MBE9067883.1 hypothetical protein [Leptolyngbya cf. ectocarpi LEGE 11479]
MFTKLCRFLRRFLHRTRTINNEPLNKVSLIVVILIDIVILSNVFIGLNDIAYWHISPTSAYPCYDEWRDYRAQTADNKDFEIVRRAALPSPTTAQLRYQQGGADRLGEVSSVCWQYGEAKDAVRSADNEAILQELREGEDEIATLNATNSKIRQQYDSTLLEEIAGQPRDQSINQVSAAQAKTTLADNEAKINALNAEMSALKNRLLAQPASAAFLALLKQDAPFQTVEQGYKKADFWYPSIQLVFQAVFLIPLILAALAVYTVAQRKHYGLIALISWHLLVIFFIPLILKVFEFLQMGVIFTIVFDIVGALFGRLLFLVSYVYILLIPLLGFGVIKFAQRFIFNPKLQAAGRVQNSRCIKCAKKIKAHDAHCPHCGYHQHRECGHCQQLTYRYLPYCNHCGTTQTTETIG